MSARDDRARTEPAGTEGPRSDGAESDDVPGDEVRRNRLLALVDVGAAADRSTSAGAALPPGSVDGRRAVEAEPGGLPARLGRVCAVSVSEVGVSGAGVTVMGSTEAGLAGRRDQLWATGPLARRLEDLQLTAGEGPCLDAYDAGAPVLAGDLAAERTRWLGFAPEAVAAGAAAAFSLPLQVGVIRLGTLDLHRTTAGALDRPQLADALVLASMATEVLLELVDPGGPPDPEGDPEGAGDAQDGPLGWLPDVHAEVHQASGMVAVRENIGVGEALLRLRGNAFARGRSIDEVARRIVDGDPLQTGTGDGDPEDGSVDQEGDR